MSERKQLTALRRAIALAGSQAELARRVAAYTKNDRVKQAHVWNWLNRDHEVPDWAVIAVENSTADSNGRPRVLRHDLRADLYPEDKAA